MKRWIFRILALLCALCLLPGSPPCNAVEVSAACAIVLDADTGRVLYEKNADEPRLIASTTKIMTGYLACLRCDPDASFTVPPEAVGVEGSSIYLQRGETLTIRALLYGTLLQSGNDAATALAIAAGGSVPQFVALMNQTARKLGLKNTHFANPHGLDAGDNYSSARDLAQLTCTALKEPEFAAAVSCRTASFGGRSFVNHNKLLWRYDDVIGVKTGYTKAAGRILVSALRRGGRTLIAVTIHAPDDWNDHTRLYDEALSGYTERGISAGDAICTLPVAGYGNATLLATENRSLLLLPDETLSCVYLGAPLLFPPLEEGADAGTVRLLIDGRSVLEIPVRFGPRCP